MENNREVMEMNELDQANGGIAPIIIAGAVIVGAFCGAGIWYKCTQKKD